MTISVIRKQLPIDKKKAEGIHEMLKSGEDTENIKACEVIIDNIVKLESILEEIIGAEEDTDSDKIKSIREAYAENKTLLSEIAKLYSEKVHEDTL